MIASASRGKRLQPQQVVLEISARRRRVKLAELGEEKMQVGKMQVGGVADDGRERHEMVAEAASLKPALDDGMKDLPVQPLVGRQSLGINCVQRRLRGFETIQPALVGLDRGVVETVAEPLVADEDGCLQRMGLQQVGPVRGDDLPQPLAGRPICFTTLSERGNHTDGRPTDHHTLDNRAEIHACDPKSTGSATPGKER